MNLKGPIRIGYPEFIFTTIAFALLVFNYTYVQELPQVASDINFSVELIIGGIVMSFLGQTVQRDEEPVTESTEQKILTYYAMSFVGAILLGIFSPKLPGLTTTEILPGALTAIAITYGVLNAVGEEWTFRGFFGNLILSRTRQAPALGCFVDALLFMLFHLFVYGSSPTALFGVFTGGFLICYADYKTKRLVTGMLTHTSINVVAAGLTIVQPVAFSMMMFGQLSLVVALPVFAVSTVSLYAIRKGAIRL